MSKERLVYLLRKTMDEQYEKRQLITPQHTADYLLANGIIVPPCKVGDTVYWIDNEKIKQGEVFEISIHSDGILVHTGTQFCLEIEQVILTKEEAEAKLKGDKIAIQ